MPFVFEEGDAIQTGLAGEHNFVLAAGEQVNDNGESPVVFEAGTGLGGGGQVTLYRDGNLVGSVGFIEPGETASNYYGYTNNRARGNWESKLDSDYLTVAVVNDSNGDYDFFYTYTDNVSGGGRSVFNTFSGMEGDYIVQDDPSGGADSYANDLTSMSHNWTSDATDGVVIGPFSSGSKSVTFTVTGADSYGFSKVRIAGASGFAETDFSLDVTYKVEFSI